MFRARVSTTNEVVAMVPTEIKEQVEQAIEVIKSLIPEVLAIHLYGSVIDGGLRPSSDIDLLVTLNHPLDESTRRKVYLELLKISAFPKTNKKLRALEVTFVVRNKIFQYPAERELQFGEWLRDDILAGIFAPSVIDHDLAILIRKARKNSITIFGPEATSLFEPVPEKDFREAMTKIISLWNSPTDWKDEERNVILTLARIWYSAVTGNIASKDVAADWLLERLPLEYTDVLKLARAEYLGEVHDDLVNHGDKVGRFIEFAKASIETILKKCS